MESASKITWFVLLTSQGKDPAGLCATWNQTASVTTLTESQGNVSWITPPQEKERKIWSRIQVMYTVELRYAKFYKLWNFVKKRNITCLDRRLFASAAIMVWNGCTMIKLMWISGFFYGTSLLSKSVTELAFSFADVLHVTLIALDHVNEIGRWTASVVWDASFSLVE